MHTCKVQTLTLIRAHTHEHFLLPVGGGSENQPHWGKVWVSDAAHLCEHMHVFASCTAVTHKVTRYPVYSNAYIILNEQWAMILYVCMSSYKTVLSYFFIQTVNRIIIHFYPAPFSFLLLLLPFISPSLCVSCRLKVMLAFRPLLLLLSALLSTVSTVHNPQPFP